MRRGLSHRVGKRHGVVSASFCAVIAVLAGGCADPEPTSTAETYWIYFRQTTGNEERQLGVWADGSYYTAVLGQPPSRRGTLTSDEMNELDALVSEEQFDRYQVEATDNCEPNQGDVEVTSITWSETTQDTAYLRYGCWWRAEVKDEMTAIFLETISNLQRALMTE